MDLDINIFYVCSLHEFGSVADRGIKKHVSVDIQSGLVNKVAISPANLTDAKSICNSFICWSLHDSRYFFSWYNRFLPYLSVRFFGTSSSDDGA